MADEVGHRLGITPLPLKTPPPTPTPSPTPAATPKPTPGYQNPLSKGAYDRRQSYPSTIPFYGYPPVYNNGN
ncbi:MAG TPA: hypothetical protein VHY22_19145 [Chthoniobacteraceae bacterium]|nr:hypothetical protein [Chthoniobacteraceae bacterium]